MIKRELTSELKNVAKQFPVVAVLGPRQSGKTTLTQSTFKKYTYVSLEELDNRQDAITDPRHFLESHKNAHGIILDEIQNTPDLLSYIQTYVDKNKKPGYFILTGSHNILLNEAISQTLAGRVSILTLLPLSTGELNKAKLLTKSIEKTLFTGCYPRIYDEKIQPNKWYSNYIRTYIERDVRLLKNVSSLNLFQKFIKLCAGRIGQLLNLTSLGNDCGISTNTAKNWLSILECSYIIFLLRPHHKNFSKRLVKSPKLYFYDTGLACSLLEIDDPKELNTSYLRGNLFESFVLSEFIKNRYNKDLRPNLYFWRDNQGHEVDCIIEKGNNLTPIEIKISKTINSSFFDELKYWNEIAKSKPENAFLIYGGIEKRVRSGIKVFGWQSLNSVFSKI
ncbi:ATP-binding protein [Candidatus Dependentiae bacterium]